MSQTTKDNRLNSHLPQTMKSL